MPADHASSLDLLTVAEFGTRFDADAAAALLQSYELDATVPDVQSAGYGTAYIRIFRVLVRAEDIEAARTILRAHGSGAAIVEDDRAALSWRGPLAAVGLLAALLLVLAIGMLQDTTGRLLLTGLLGADLLGLVLIWATAPLPDDGAPRAPRRPRLVRPLAGLLVALMVVPALVGFVLLLASVFRH